MKTQEEKKLFYAKCAEILNIENEYNIPVPRRTRWNNRNIGNGRYPGFGLVQCFGNTTRVISKNGTRIFNTYDEVYLYLSQLKR
jgi:hypothetical protein